VNQTQVEDQIPCGGEGAGVAVCGGEAVIRRAGTGDADGVTAMLSGLSDLALYFRFQTAVGRPPRPSLVEPLLCPSGAAWVVERSDELVGHAMWAWAKGSQVPTAELAVVIAHSAQRRGLGLAMLRLAATDAYSAGAAQLLLVVNAANDKVIRMIRRHVPGHQVERDGALLNYLVPADSRWLPPQPAGTPPAVLQVT
jgi:hypothetical protein